MVFASGDYKLIGYVVFGSGFRGLGLRVRGLGSN